MAEPASLQPLTSELLLSVFGIDVCEGRLEPHAMLYDDLGADSLDLVELQFELEERGIDAPGHAFTSIMTVADLDRLIVAETAHG